VIDRHGVIGHVGFFWPLTVPDDRDYQGWTLMEQSKQATSNVAQQIAEAALAFHQQRTGHTPASVTVVLGVDTVVITLHGALSPAEQVMAQSQIGAAQVREFHRELFNSSAAVLRGEIKRITGVEVREAVADVEPTIGSVVQVFTTGTMVQVFQLVHNVPTDTWNGNGSSEQHEKMEEEPRIGGGWWNQCCWAQAGGYRARNPGWESATGFWRSGRCSSSSIGSVGTNSIEDRHRRLATETKTDVNLIGDEHDFGYRR
jgi:uncharacterized protein YbcI